MQKIEKDRREMPVIEDNAVTQHIEICQTESAQKQAEQARTTHSDDTTYNF